MESTQIDDITCESIPTHRLISITEGEKTYHFDIVTLLLANQNKKEYINPFTRNTLPEEIIKSIVLFKHENQIVVNARYNLTSNGTTTFSMENYLTIGDLIIKTLRESGDRYPLTDIGRYPIKDKQQRYLYDMNLSSKISDIFPSMKEISLHCFNSMNPRWKVGLGKRLHKVYLYGKERGLEWIQSCIPKKYHILPSTPIHHASILDAQLLHDFLDTFQSKYIKGSENTPSHLMEYLQVGLGRHLAHSYLTVSQSQEIDEKILGFGLIKYDTNEYTLIAKQLFSRVVDKHNLHPDRRIEGYYYRDEYDVNESNYFDMKVPGI